MICKIGKGKGFSGIVSYTLKRDATLLLTKGIRTSTKAAMAFSFTLQSQLNTRVKNPVGHHILSCSPQDADRLTDDLILQITMEYLRRMGIVNTQLMIVRHHDRKHPHVHIVFNRIDNNGKTISDKNDRYRAIKICKDLTREYGLSFGLGKNHVNRGRLKGADVSKYYIFDELEKVKHNCRNWSELGERLKERGIDVRYKVLSGSSEIQGVSFCHNGYSFRGSKIDRSYSFSNLTDMLKENSKMGVAQSTAPAISKEISSAVATATNIVASAASLFTSVGAGNGTLPCGGGQASPTGKRRKKDWWEMSEEERILASKGYSL